MSYDIIIENFDNNWNEYENYNSNENDELFKNKVAPKKSSNKKNSKKSNSKKAGVKKAGPKKTGPKKAGIVSINLNNNNNGIKPIDNKAIIYSSINNFDKEFPNLYDRPRIAKPLVKVDSNPQIKHGSPPKKINKIKIKKKKALKPVILSLNTGSGDKLFNQRYCNILPTKNSYITCNNCTFDNKYLKNGKYKEIIYKNQNQCFNNCNKDIKCTGYTYNYKNKKCTKYSGYPRDTIKSKNINSGYILNIKRPLHYNRLSKKAQENIKKKCAGQYLNLQYRNIHSDLTNCIKKISNKNKKTSVEIDKKCAFKSLDRPKTVRKYIFKTSFPNSRKDPNIDNAHKVYKQYTVLRKKNKKALTSLQNKQDKNSNYESIKNTYNSNLDKIGTKMSDKQTNKQNKIKEKISKLIGIKEGFISETNNNNNILYIVLLIIMFIFIIYIIKNL